MSANLSSVMLAPLGMVLKSKAMSPHHREFLA